MTDPLTDWLADMDARIANMQEKSAALQESFAASGATASSPDGLVRVTVGPTGALQDVQLSPSVTRYPPAELASIINRTAAQAQRVAAHQVAAAFAPMAEGTEAMRMVQSFLPPPPEPESGAPQDGLAADEEADADNGDGARPLTPVTPPAAPRPTRPLSTKDDDDFDQPW